jgi:bifunctional DNA-binding transcriptional regulator/antitoxin component of YhaV-PrlF toxin-antitoxin module
MVDKAQILRFSATLTRQPDSSATYITVPADIFSVYGVRGRVMVTGTLNGYEYHSSIFPYGGVHYLGVNRDAREAAGLKAGDIVEVVMQIDDTPRVVAVPDDLAKAFKENPQAYKNWKKLSYSHQKEYVKAIEEAKKADTRQERVRKTIERLTQVAWHEES